MSRSYVLPHTGDVLLAKENNPDNPNYIPPPPALASPVQKQEWYQAQTQHRAWEQNNQQEVVYGTTFANWLTSYDAGKLDPGAEPPKPPAAYVCVCTNSNGALEIKASGLGQTTVDDTDVVVPPSGPYIPVCRVPDYTHR